MNKLYQRTLYLLFMDFGNFGKYSEDYFVNYILKLFALNVIF